MVHFLCRKVFLAIKQRKKVSWKDLHSIKPPIEYTTYVAALKRTFVRNAIPVTFPIDS